MDKYRHKLIKLWNHVVVKENQLKRNYIMNSTNHSFSIFDSSRVVKRRNMVGKRNLREFEYINDEIATNLVDRAEFILKDFPSVVDLGCGNGNLLAYLRQREQEEMINDRFQMKDYFALDVSLEHLENVQKEFKGLETNPFHIHSVVASPEALPFKEENFDLVFGNQGMHWVNHPHETLNQVFRILKDDGVFIGAFMGGDTLHELRSSFIFAEQEREGGVSPHVSPFLNARDVGDMMARIGFNLPTIDVDEITVYYPDAFTLMHHLQMMGESSALTDARGIISKETIYGAAAIYDSLYYDEEKKGIPATFQIIYAIGWKPHPNQPKPVKRGSATVSMKQIADGVGSQVGIISEAEDGSIHIQDNPDAKIDVLKAQRENAGVELNNGEEEEEDEELRERSTIPFL